MSPTKSLRKSGAMPKFDHIVLDVQGGVAKARLHSSGGPMIWGPWAHTELSELFDLVDASREIRVLILTGTGPTFINHWDASARGKLSGLGALEMLDTARKLVEKQLNCSVTMIAAVNGPAGVHAEIALLCDVVLAAEEATFGDLAHLPNGMVPGDGAHVVWPALIGPNRARSMFLTQRVWSSEEAASLGLVSEVLPRSRLDARAAEIADRLLGVPEVTLRLTRRVLTAALRREMGSMLDYGLLAEGIAALDHWPRPR